MIGPTSPEPASDSAVPSADLGAAQTIEPPTAQWVVPTARNTPGLFPPIHLTDDLRNVPRLATRGYSIIVPGFVLIVVFALFQASGANLANQSLQTTAFNLSIFPPSWFLPILAGVLTQRSSYLAGGLVGLLSGILFSIYVMTATFGPSSSGEFVTTDLRIQNAVYALVVSTLVGLALGGIGGFLQRLGREIFTGS